ncbi:MAG: hypothetical protein J6A01_06565 [Proteobacteria bacterium]|nr:hypothetical protein [Pseudomonadota bacterium]
MAVCLVCSQKSKLAGELCACGKAYTVHDDHGDDPLHILGTQIANKFIPVAVRRDTDSVIYYEAYQPSIDRTVLLVAIKSEWLNSQEKNAYFQNYIDRSASIKQQNTLSLLEVQKLSDQKNSFVMIYEALKGESLPAYLSSHTLDPVAIMHIIHQILQAIAAFHQKGVRFPSLSFSNVHILRSGGDEVFVKLSNLVETYLSGYDIISSTDDVYSIGQMALSLITGQPMPIQQVELSPERAFMLPIAQIFMRAASPIKDQRYSSCIELLQAFETAFDLNSHDPNANLPNANARDSSSKQAIKRHTPVPLEQVIWMHRPPHLMG